MKFTTEQYVFIVESFARKKPYRKCIRKFCHKYLDSPVPSSIEALQNEITRIVGSITVGELHKLYILHCNRFSCYT
jgi:hypothetical protein